MVIKVESAQEHSWMMATGSCSGPTRDRETDERVSLVVRNSESLIGPPGMNRVQ